MNIPELELEILARHFLPYIQTFFETAEGKKEYEEWKAERKKLMTQKSSEKIINQ